MMTDPENNDFYSKEELEEVKAGLVIPNFSGYAAVVRAMVHTGIAPEKVITETLERLEQLNPEWHGVLASLLYAGLNAQEPPQETVSTYPQAVMCLQMILQVSPAQYRDAFLRQLQHAEGRRIRAVIDGPSLGVDPRFMQVVDHLLTQTASAPTTPLASFELGEMPGRTIGENLVYIYTKLGMTQLQVAHPFFSISYISAIKRNMIRPSLKALALLALNLRLENWLVLLEGVSTDAILGKEAGYIKAVMEGKTEFVPMRLRIKDEAKIAAAEAALDEEEAVEAGIVEEVGEEGAPEDGAESD